MNYFRAFQRYDDSGTSKMKLDDLDKILQELGKSGDERWRSSYLLAPATAIAILTSYLFW